MYFPRSKNLHWILSYCLNRMKRNHGAWIKRPIMFFWTGKPTLFAFPWVTLKIMASWMGWSFISTKQMMILFKLSLYHVFCRATWQIGLWQKTKKKMNTGIQKSCWVYSKSFYEQEQFSKKVINNQEKNQMDKWTCYDWSLCMPFCF